MRLETFGGLALTGGSTSNLPGQRRRLAFLALLAAAGERGLSRDQLLGYLWTESSSETARHSLEQLLYGLRRSLGDDAFVGVNPIRLNREVVSSDLDDFEAAVSGGLFAQAVALYHGSFLSGFFLDAAPEFEKWTESQRARLAGRYTDALHRLAEGAEKSGDHAAAAEWRKRLVEADPLSSRHTLAYLRALVTSGDRGAALQHARVHELLVRRELESAPDPSITAFAAALRAEAADPSPRTMPRGAVLVSPQSQVASSPPASDVQPPTPYVQPRDTDLRRLISNRRMRYLAIGAVAVFTAMFVLRSWTAHPRAPLVALDPNTIVIVPFSVRGLDSSVTFLGDGGIVDLLAPMLTGEGGLRAIDSRSAIATWNRITRGGAGTADDARRVARALGAGNVLFGTVVQAGRKLTVAGNVMSADSPDTRPLTAVTGRIDSSFALLDQFAVQLLTRHAGVPEFSLATLTSRSVPALRAYLSGRAATRRANDDEAIAAFARALDIDSTFALAALSLATTTAKILHTRICLMDVCRSYSMVPAFSPMSMERDDDAFNRATRLAVQHRARLSRRDRIWLDALSYPPETSARETLAGLFRAVGAAPDRPETQYLLGVFLLYQGLAVGHEDAQQSAEVAFRQALKLDSTYLAPMARLVDVAAFQADTAKLRRVGAQYLTRDSTGPTADYVRWLAAAATNDDRGLRAIRARLPSFSRTTLAHILSTSQMSGYGLDDGDSASSLLIERAVEPIDKNLALFYGYELALNRGRPALADRLLRRRRLMESSDDQFWHYSVVSALYMDGDAAAANRAARGRETALQRDTLLAMSPNADALFRLVRATAAMAVWYLQQGDTARAWSAVDWLRRQAPKNPRFAIFSAVPEMLRGSLLRSPQLASQQAHVDSITLRGCCSGGELGLLGLADGYERNGEFDDALRVLRRGVWFWPPRNLAAILRREGRLADRVGDRAGAVRAYEHFLALRSDPEPRLRAQRDSVRAALNLLKNGR